MCIKEGHEKSKMSYICGDPICTNLDKLGCAYCFLEEHTSHVSKKLKIDEFSECVNKICSEYGKSVTEIDRTIEEMSNP